MIDWQLTEETSVRCILEGETPGLRDGGVEWSGRSWERGACSKFRIHASDDVSLKGNDFDS